MTGVDVNDPNFDVFEFLGVDWCKSSSMETSGRGGQRYSAGRAVAFSSGDNAPGCGREAVVFARSGDPLRGTALSAAAHIATSAYTNSVRGTAAPAAGTAACLVASETKITAVKSRFTVMEDECAAPMKRHGRQLDLGRLEAGSVVDREPCYAVCLARISDGCRVWRGSVRIRERRGPTLC
ncbi:hypothetical protein PC122_g15317 [Phytophthora cactorum]|nr:hypothetical protein PC122_g15317 [Phytophthora cactorum]